MSCGIYRIYNIQDDSSFVGKSDDIENVCAAERFRLDLGMHPCAPLQKDYTEIGLELFAFDVVEKCAQADLDTAYERVLKDLEERKIRIYPA